MSVLISLNQIPIGGLPDERLGCQKPLLVRIMEIVSIRPQNEIDQDDRY